MSTSSPSVYSGSTAYLKRFISTCSIPLGALFIFMIIGCIVWYVRDVRYFWLFTGIGISEFFTRLFVINFPKLRQLFRRITQALIGGFLLFFLSIAVGVNFQFPQIFFDFQAAVVTGALIQFVIARLFLPFFFGNAFCSRACWSGVFFELTNNKSCKTPMKRNPWLAWGYLFGSIAIAYIFVHYLSNPATNDSVRKSWIIAENILILSLGFVLTFKLGSRAYCRLLCPFLTVSGLFSPFAMFKVTPVKSEACISCNKCNVACPMLIDVKSKALQREKIADRSCILCERCVSSCPKSVLKMTNKKVM